MERTVVDWMFEHPYLTTIILLAFCESIGELGKKTFVALKRTKKV